MISCILYIGKNLLIQIVNIVSFLNILEYVKNTFHLYVPKIIFFVNPTLDYLSLIFIFSNASIKLLCDALYIFTFL